MARLLLRVGADLNDDLGANDGATPLAAAVFTPPDVVSPEASLTISSVHSIQECPDRNVYVPRRRRGFADQRGVSVRFSVYLIEGVQAKSEALPVPDLAGREPLFMFGSPLRLAAEHHKEILMRHPRIAHLGLLLLFLAAGCMDRGLTTQPAPPGDALHAAMPKTDVCHRTTGGNFIKITVADAAYETHIAHGDAGIGEPVPGMAGYNFDDACQPVEAAVEIVQATITGGFYHSCGLDATGTAYCWGYNNVGQLGDGTTTDRSTPVVVSTAETFIAIAAGQWHTVALTAAGDAFAWGYNQFGQLGDGTTWTTRSTPVAVSTAERFTAIGAGQAHTVALTAAGDAFAWGRNVSGQLGDGTTTDRNTPVPVSTAETFTAISPGGQFTVALTSAGDAFAWGRGDSGQLGDGTATSRSTPVAVSTAETFTAISGGQAHTVALTSSGDAFAWGRNNYGQLGDGTTTDRSTPVAGSTAETITAISAGGFHTVALTSSGDAFAWGRNNYGQLGDGTTTDRSTPVAVSIAETFTAIAAGSWHTVALTSSGDASTWGWNFYGQLGHGTTTDRSTPVAVTGGIVFAH